MKLAIAIPTYNEAPNLEILVPLIKSELKNSKDLQTTVFIIDDNSPDKTAAVAEELGRKNKNKNFSVKVIKRAKKEGLGAAYIDGFQQILKKDFDFILQMDADISHNPTYIPSFVAATKRADFVVGSRYVEGGSAPDWGLLRKILSLGANFYARTLLSSKVTDYTGGFNLYSSDLLKNLGLETIDAPGYGFLIQLKYRAVKKAKNIRQVPIVFNDRQHGKSKIPRDTIIKNLILVPLLRLSIKK